MTTRSPGEILEKYGVPKDSIANIESKAMLDLNEALLAIAKSGVAVRSVKLIVPALERSDEREKK